MAKSDLTVEVTVELDLSDRYITAKEADVVVRHIKAAVAEALPAYRLRGNWVQSKPK